MAKEEDMRVRQAEPSDVDAVTDVLIMAMPADRDWWDYRFLHREQYPEVHRRLFRLLVETWVAAEFEDWIVMVAEVYDATTCTWQMGAYAAWDVAYVNRRKHGSAYQPLSVAAVLLAAGAATRRDADTARMTEHSRAADEAHEKFLDPLYGTNQIHLQALGTHPSFTHRGLARALCQWGQDRAARDGTVITLSAAPMGRSVYPRFGFRELGMVTAQVEGEETRTHLWPMVWEPKNFGCDREARKEFH
ncbi:hypothetical protein N0V93_003619 [Gnomoniopsis smithogilvyi]|uniref:N-acetyltransferase domain-containing protein n=1 Tax=Gnomoniopsis smithogilvyi TaxID=1191159 RepID=A0A9W8Z0S8_9PEZI|nr:hypothetical protein N0V93_003619 [Gnomoniopsis smithogilvyi]